MMLKRMTYILVVLASFYANADVVKSSISSKRISEIQQAAPVENPYVVDGLIGMWDGEWNVGFGKHSSMTSKWFDLSGHGRIANLTGTYSWGKNFWHVESTSIGVSGRGMASWPALNLGTNQTIEFVIDPIATYNPSGRAFSRVIADGPNVPSPCITSFGALYMYGYGLDTAGPAYSAMEMHLHQITRESQGMLKYYIDGILMWTQKTYSDSTGDSVGYFANNRYGGRGLDANYYVVRIYNRVLTESEIMHNYAIDKERFGLP